MTFILSYIVRTEKYQGVIMILPEIHRETAQDSLHSELEHLKAGIIPRRYPTS